MLKQKLHFEQVPLEVVRKTVEEQNVQQEKSERVQSNKKAKLETYTLRADEKEEWGGKL